ncbi:NlpC/P60 family protein [Flavobacterium resistens]|uniref:Glycoside hydrolase n=1 Tax=Flavobacterium resistens TaxID=443612 RepID=A0A521DU38_9FLAO|nr:C40 family peptidase [Flavobacterium resistens]MRX68211.1 glycoside hydrolase [Flavobacterium resistens]SMO74631.1 NlpC/P60 family protein [Flavobacterium resistens]
MKSSLYIFLLFVILFSSFKNKEKEKQIHVHFETNKNQADRDSIVAYAKKYLGTPYVYAGNDPKKGFDCSGFVNYVFKNYGVTLPRSSGEYKNIGTKLNPEEFKVGDILVFYGYKDKTIIGHLGIICEANGMKSKFIHASSGKAQCVTITSLDTEHYTNRFYKCIDVLTK